MLPGRWSRSARSVLLWGCGVASIACLISANADPQLSHGMPTCHATISMPHSKIASKRSR
jgi:hypothetical protein